MNEDSLRELLRITVHETQSVIESMDAEALGDLKYRLRGVAEEINDYLSEV